jgi:polyphosphate glucokinase
VLVVDIGGTHIKFLASGQTEHRMFPSGPAMTPKRMVSRVKKLSAGWKYGAVSIGLPGTGSAEPAGGRATQSRPRVGRVSL